jgi:uncharacterized membrane protein YGL010W
VGLLGDRSAEAWIAAYEGSHRQPVNRACHALGIPMILVSLIVLAGSLLSPRLWAWGVGLFVAGWSLQLVGHAFEGRRPEFLRDWRFLLVGARWWWMTATRRLHRS